MAPNRWTDPLFLKLRSRVRADVKGDARGKRGYGWTIRGSGAMLARFAEKRVDIQ